MHWQKTYHAKGKNERENSLALLSGRFILDLLAMKTRVLLFGFWLFTFVLHAAGLKSGLAAISVPEGFAVELAAGSELAPYGMLANFDGKGRLFVAASSGKNIGGLAMSKKPECSVYMLADLNGDGVFDKRTMFVGKVGIPMGVLCWQGDVFVASPPDVWRFRDTDGDGVANVREVLASGWFTRGTASLHGPFLGPEGWLYLTDGRHGFDIHTKEGRHYKGLASRIWRMRTDGTGLEPVAGGGMDNPVEVAFNAAGEMFGTMTYFTNPRNGQRDSLMHFLEGGVYLKWHSSVSEFKLTGDLLGPMTRFARVAPSGLMRYRGQAFGPKYRGNLFSAHFNPQRIQRHVLKRSGATFVTLDSEFLHSTDPNFHPTDVLEAPDGSLLVIDTGAWYIDQCPLSRISRPEHKGGIYRIRKKGAPKNADPLGARLGWDDIAPERLTRLLADPRPFVQSKAMDYLAVRDKGIMPHLAALLKDKAIPAEAQCRAIWALHRQGSNDARAIIRSVLKHASPDVRIAAARSVGLAKDAAALGEMLDGLRAKESAVSREIATAIGFIGDKSAATALARAATHSADAHHDHAIIRSLIQLNDPKTLAEQLQKGPPKVRRASLIALDQIDDSPLNMKQVAPHLDSADPALARAALWVMTHHPDWASGILGYLRTQFKKKQWTDPETQALRDALHAFAPNPEVQKLIGEMLGSKLPVAHQLFLLDAVEKSEVKKLPAGWIKALGDIVMRTREPEHSRLRVIAVARSHNIDTLDLQLKQVATNKDAPTSLRLAALGALAPRLKIVAPEIIRYLLDLTIADSAVTRGAAARVLGQMNLDEKQILEVAVRAIPKADAITLTPLLSTFTRNQTEATGRSLVTALSEANPKSLNAAQIRQTIDAQSDVVKTSAAPLLAKLAAREKAQAVHLAKLDPLLAGGDVGRGRRVFFGQKAACSACHAIGEEGSRLGPDLTSIGAIRAGRDILEAIVFPSASQVPGYEAFLVLTNAGEAHMGVIARETTDFLTLRVANNVEQRIERAQIKSIQPAPISLMPQGLDKNLSRQELADLLTFLQSQNGERWLQPDRLGIKDIRVRDSGIRE